ncbi:MAG: WecB/TagA/CpsF family glycosyltransferase [Blastocatellia bacterium]|nr:WecB/TagA/CpsF family glycosyltransferase [Blastocatellia bacterium]
MKANKTSRRDEGRKVKDEKEDSSFHPSSFIPHPSERPSTPAPLLPCSPASLHRVKVAGIAINNLSEAEVLNAIDGLIAQGGAHYMVVVNAAKAVAASRDERLRSVLDEADLVTADGMSVVWASRLLGRPLKERVTGIDLFERLLARAEARELQVYFLGAREEIVRALVERLTTQYPNLRVAGYRNGYFDQSEAEAVAEEIKRSRADLLFVAIGSPAQEYWIRSNLSRTGVRFAMGVGGSFDHLSGRARRAPQWMQRTGLEWLYRLLREPRRLWRRYLVGNTLFVWLVGKQLLKGDQQRDA